MDSLDWRKVYDFWFPDELKRGKLDFHLRTSEWWMKGGSNAALPPFEPCVRQALAGSLDHWADEPLGRLALILVLDQFPRGLYPGTPAAFAGDQQALRLTREGLANAHYAALSYPWEQFFFVLPLHHAEGPDHAERLTLIRDSMEAGLPATVVAYPELRPILEFSLNQARSSLELISTFGRFPHRNAVLGRESTPEERAYIDKGDFLHLRSIPKS